MMNDFLAIGFWKKLAALITGSLLLSGHTGAASFFEALELSPVEVARSGLPLPASTLATLPASEAERQQLIAAILEPVAGVAAKGRCGYAAQLLEIWGERARALEILEQQPAVDFDQVHLMRLRYRSGKLDAARETFAAIQAIPPPIGPTNDLPACRIQMAVEPFIARESFTEMAEFLAWLQPQCRVSEWRSAVLAQRLNLALHCGTLDALLAVLTRESVTTRAIAERMLDPGSPLVTPDAGTPVLDLAWLVEIDGCSDQAAPFLGEAIRTGAGSEAERAELLRQFVFKYHDHEPRTRLLGEWIGREAEFIRLLTGLGPVLSFSANLPYEPLCRLAERHPDDAYLNFLAGFNQTSRYNDGRPVVVTQSALDCLVRAVVSAPLPVGKPGPDGDLNIQTRGTHGYPRWRDDPARFALQQLAGRLSTQRLHDLLYSRDDFKALPVPDRIRYLDAAELDLLVLEETFKTDWHDPKNDAYGGSVFFPFSPLRTPPREALERYDALQPDIILGSPEKPAALVAAHSQRPLRILFGYKQPRTASELEMVRRWHTGLLERGPEFAQRVLAEGPQYRGGELDLELMSQVLGKEAAEHEAQSWAEVTSIAAKLQACSCFGPLGLRGFPVGYSPDNSFDVLTIMGPRWIGEDSFSNPPAAWLIPRHPALAGLLENFPYSSMPAATPGWAAKLRSQLPATSPIAAAYDIAIATKIHQSPDPAAAARAESHVGAMLKTRADPDFVLFRASSGISLKHGKPPADPAAIEELAKLRDAPAPVRIAAADLALKSDGDRKDKLLAVLNSKGSSFPNRGTPPPEPIPPPVPSMAQWIATLKAAPDLEELCKILAGMPESYQMEPYFAILLPEVLARFAKPHHERLMELLRLDLEPACGTSGRDTTAPGPSLVEVRRLHAFFSKQDAKTAADFRALAVARGWAGGDYSGQIAQELLKDGQRAAAIEWLANMVIQRRFPPCWSEPYRFPIRQNIPDDYLLSRIEATKGLAKDLKEAAGQKN